MPATALLELRGISKRFGAVQALSQVDFETYPGEVVALVGDNGAGKSTLIKTISGILPIDEGQALFEGRPVKLEGPQSASALGIATVYQDLALCDNLDVVGNLFLGREVRTGGIGSMLGWLDETAMERQAAELLRKLSVSIPSVRTQVAALSGGQRQSIAVARSMMGSPKVVLLDEPTAALGVAQTRQVLDLIRRLREQGLGVVVISHNLVDVFSVADRIIVMRLGRRVATFDVKSVKEVEVVSAITGVNTAEVAQTLSKGES
ncbi:ATP-binding cassette domain-containing protein [Archangium sp.]|uniref:ATP-binding cassette domain-containing protein n=1 Tax=Archangium sp. TaxID=1872627 RepID=UPI002D32EFF5|nr:ATP-binding cassette domain-containing protein [Archangium sp.]HYO59868.1 ATP-binding cassette domain-containing protein [Archangium sp.]